MLIQSRSKVSGLLAISPHSLLWLAAAGILIMPPSLHAQGIDSGNSLKSGERITSTDGRYSLLLQVDGNLVWLQGDKAIWAAGTNGTSDAVCRMQKDGNLVVYGTRHGKTGPVWASNTANRPGSSLKCQSDGNLVIYQNTTPVWASASQKNQSTVPEVAVAGGATLLGGLLGYGVTSAAGASAVGVLGSGAGFGMAAGPVGAGVGALAGLAGYGVYRLVCD